jgi:hypothetical protein
VVTAGAPTRGRTRARGRARALYALLVPADRARAVTVLLVLDTAAVFSTALGEVPFDAVPATHAGARCALYVPDDDTVRPDNPRAAVLAARLGLHDRAVQARLRGDVLVTGLHPDHDKDQDVPADVITLATRHLGPVHGPTPRR